MKNYHSGEIILLSFPFTDVTGVKRRPALVLLDTGDEDAIVARVTSQAVQTIFDVELVEWQQAGLLIPSVVRVDKLATLGKRLVERRLGMLTSSDWMRVVARVKQLCASIANEASIA
jgi:mRNA interferase MazF